MTLTRGVGCPTQASVPVSLPDPGPPNPEFEQPATEERFERVAGALARRGFTVQVADHAAQARQLVLDSLPKGAEVHSALSETLEQLGVSAEIDESGEYDAIRPKLRALDRKTQARQMRKLGAAPDFIVGSAHAVTEDGDVLVASGSGSQIGGYAYSAGNVILVVGYQKLVRDVAEGLRRIREYCLPKEFLRMQAAGRSGTLLAETLILYFDPRHRVRVILLKERLGF